MLSVNGEHRRPTSGQIDRALRLTIPRSETRHTFAKKDHGGPSSRPVNAMFRRSKTRLVVLVVLVIGVAGCQDLVPRDTASLLVPKLQRSEIFGFVAGLGTTFAGFPDLVAMLKRKSSAGMNPRMAAIMGIFQVWWVYYGLLIASRPVIAWNLIAILINFLTVGAYLHYRRREARKTIGASA
jgi:uncharacterized protein with PQ loop repeat